MTKKIIITIFGIFFLLNLHAQEIQARLSINSDKISTQTDKKIFTTLQTALLNFINNRKWTNDAFQPNEKIQCNFLLILDRDLGNDVFSGKLTIQAARPIYNTNYQSPLVNFLDDNVVFRYKEFQPIEFNENRIQGTDAFSANLTAIFAFWINVIIGLDYDSFQLRNGETYLHSALNIVNNAPEDQALKGWRSFDGQRNRYWIAENMNNPRMSLIQDALYNYYRMGFDLVYENDETGRTGVLNSLNFLNTISFDLPGNMFTDFFFQGKGTELFNLFNKANPDTKLRAKELLIKLDLTNSSLYKGLN